VKSDVLTTKFRLACHFVIMCLIVKNVT